MCRTHQALFSHSNSFQMCVYILYIVSTNNCITDKVINLIGYEINIYRPRSNIRLSLELLY